MKKWIHRTSFLVFFPKLRQPIIAYASWGLCLSLLCSCAYRFSNLHLRAPSGAKTVAIEAIFDTSRNVMPHEYLWESLQRHFAIDGHLRLTSQSQADVYVRAHLQSAIQSPSHVDAQRLENPSHFFDPKKGQPFPLSAYPSFQTAHSYAKSETLSLSVQVEAWDLRSEKRLLQKTYSSSASYVKHDGSTPAEYAFLQVEEALEQLFAERAEDIARQVVRDVLSL